MQLTALFYYLCRCIDYSRAGTFVRMGSVVAWYVVDAVTTTVEGMAEERQWIGYGQRLQ